MLVVEPALPEFGGGRVGENTKFAEGVYGRLENVTPVDAVVVLDAVNQKLIGLRPQAIHRIGLHGSQGPPGILEALRDRRHPGLQQSQLGEIAAIKRQVEDVVFIHCLTQIVGGFQLHRVSRHLHHLLRRAHHELHRYAGNLIHAQRDAFLNVLLKTGCCRFQAIVAHRQENQQIAPVGLADCLAV